MKSFFIGSDHAGARVKRWVSDFFCDKKIVFHDLSPSNKEGDDYPDVAHLVSRSVFEKKAFGVLVCGTGIGMSIAANKHKGIRAALCKSPREAELARKHNNANVLVLSGRSSKKDALLILKKFISSNFEGGRHLRRVNKIRKFD